MTTLTTRGKLTVFRCGKTISIIFLVLTNLSLFAQGRLIDKFELVAGSGVIINAGSGHAEDDRMTKYGFTFGAGSYHSFSPSFKLNFRILWELKGYKASEPYYNPYSNANEISIIERSISYLTLSLIPTVVVGSKKKALIGFGGYYSFPQSVKDIATRKDLSGNIISQVGGNTKKIPDNVHNDVGLSLSFGYRIRVTRESSFMIQVVNSVGVVYFTNAFGYDIRNHIASLLLTYNFSPKSKKLSKIGT